MENPGLITYEQSVLTANRDFVYITAHELAHQWFGNTVTPAWWEHLWLSEAFASWLGERVSTELGAPPPLGFAHHARADAIAADEQPGALALIHPITRSSEIEPAFNAIAYDKGAAVLAMFERFAPAQFRAAVQDYLTAHAGTAVESNAFFAVLARGTIPALSAALASNLQHPGVPVVELSLRCTGQPAVIATVRGGASLPVCVRLPDAPGAATAHSTTQCALAGAATELALPPAAGCPAWVVGNAGGLGYYRTVWRGAEPAAPVAALTADERLARGDDVSLAFTHGERSARDALAELSALAASGEPMGAVAAVTIAAAIDPVVGEADRDAWARWLAARFAGQLTAAALGAPPNMLDDSLREPLVDLTRGALSHNVLTTLRVAGPHRAYNLYVPLAIDAALDGVRDRDQVFAQMANAAATTRRPELRTEMIERLGAFPGHFAPRLIDAMIDPRFAPSQLLPALGAMLARGESRDAAWHALHARAAQVAQALGTGASALLMTVASAAICDAGARAELVADFAGAPPEVKAGRLAAIDRCIARRAAAGGVAAALASTPQR
jgi:alanyl aminopeptidase